MNGDYLQFSVHRGVLIFLVFYPTVAIRIVSEQDSLHGFAASFVCPLEDASQFGVNDLFSVKNPVAEASDGLTVASHDGGQRQIRRWREVRSRTWSEP